MRRSLFTTRHSLLTPDSGSHIGIIRSATAFRRHPADVLVGVFDIAGFAVDAVLRIDDKARLPAVFRPFVNRSRTVARRGSGIDVVLGRFLQSIVAHQQMGRLILLMIGVRQIDRRQPVEGEPPIGLGIGDRGAMRRGMQRFKVRLAVLERAKELEAERAGPHIETAERHTGECAQFRP